jgi:hypothetical protein
VVKVREKTQVGMWGHREKDTVGTGRSIQKQFEEEEKVK